MGKEINLLNRRFLVSDVGKCSHVLGNSPIFTGNSAYGEPLGINLTILATVPNFTVPVSF